MGSGFYLLEHAHEVPAEDLLHIAIGQAALQQPGGDARQRRGGLQSFRERWDAVEVAADADVVDAGDLHRVDDVVDGVLERRDAAASYTPSGSPAPRSTSLPMPT